MSSKSKKTKAAGRFGARYGKRPRAYLAAIEEKQRKKQRCPFCGKFGAKRLSKGLWQCIRKKCGKKFASDVYYLPTPHELKIPDKVSIPDNIVVSKIKNKKFGNLKKSI